MLGTIVNAGAILLGGGIGLLLKKGIPQRVGDAIMKVISLCIIYIGISGALEGNNVLVVVLSIVFGAVLGTLLDLDGRLNRMGERIQRHIVKDGRESTFAKGLVTSTLLFCVGAMAVVGSLSSGLTGDYSTLYAKSLIDGITAMVFATTMGVGVLFSALFVLIYQGTITLLAQFVAPILSAGVIAEMTCTGSLMIIGLGLNMLGVTKFKVMDYVPGIFIAIGVYKLFELFGIL
ncbi:MAG: DUF554 domain-containing protein [Clostridia bacterium]